jgi:hypothetical protein
MSVSIGALIRQLGSSASVPSAPLCNAEQPPPLLFSEEYWHQSVGEVVALFAKKLSTIGCTHPRQPKPISCNASVEGPVHPHGKDERDAQS